MRIEAITLRELRMELRAPFETSFGITRERRIPLVEVRADGVSGWGEITAPEGPFYNYETIDTAWHIVRDFIAPLLLGRKLGSACEVPALLAAIRGHQMAKAGVENALWDVEAQQKGLPLAKLLGGTYEEIVCGVSIGLQTTTEALLSKIDTELKAGYQRIKIKIKPGKDLQLVRAVREKFPQVKLMVDANSAYRLADAEHLKKLDDYYLMMIEQPLPWDDMHEHARLQAQLQTPICLDESIHHARHAQAAIESRACQIINVKLGRVGGHTEARRVEEVCRARSIPVWCGGMLESGVGRAHNIAMSTLAGFVLPGDVSASQRYWEEDIIEPEVEVTSAGTIRVPTAPGLGYAVRRQRVEQLTVRQETWRAQ
jgi:O-succinylbenzoate synthase